MMEYYARIIASRHDYRKGTWTCDATAVGIDTTKDENHYKACLNYVDLLAKKMNLLPYVILYKTAPFGFNRVEKFKGLNSQKSKLSLWHCLDFFTSDNGCEYLFVCAPIDPLTTSPDIFDTHQTVVFLGTEKSYQKLTTSIPSLKSIQNIENFLINSGMIVVEDYDTIDIGSTLWFVSNDEVVSSLVKVLSHL